MRDELLVTLSEQHRERPGLAVGAAERVEESIRTDLGKVEIEAPPAVTLSSDSGPLGVTLVNGLDQPVEVQVQVRTDGELTLSGGGVRRLGPGARSVVRFEATTSRAGVHNVRLAVTSLDGVPLGSFDSLPIRAARVSAIIWIVMALGALVLFGMIGYRLPGQIRARRAELAAADSEPEPEPDPSDRPRDRPRAGAGRRARSGDPGGGALVSDQSDQKVLASSADHGGGHRPVPRVGLRARRAAGRRPRLGPAGRPLRDRQHAAQHGLHPPGRRHLQRGAGAAAGPADQGGRRRRRRLRQPGDHPLGALPGRRDDRPRRRRTAAAAPLPRQSLPRPGPGHPAGVDRLPDPLVPAAGLLLRHVRPRRAGPQRPRALRSDDVGADRQQPAVGPDAGHLPRLLRTDRGRRGPVRGAQHRPGGHARPRLDAGDRGPVPRPRALPARLGVHLPAPLRLPRPRAGEDAVPGQLDGAVRRRHPGGVPRRGQARVGRHGRAAATAPATSSTPTAC